MKRYIVMVNIPAEGHRNRLKEVEYSGKLHRDLDSANEELESAIKREFIIRAWIEEVKE